MDQENDRSLGILDNELRKWRWKQEDWMRKGIRFESSFWHSNYRNRIFFLFFLLVIFK